MEVLSQKGPACGTTSLAMIIRFLTQDSGITPEDIDKEIRKLPGMFSAPLDLIAYVRKKGLQAEEYNHNSLQQMENLVTQGIPVMPLLDLTPDNALDFDQWHWVVVVAVEKINGRTILIINNPWGRQEEWGQEKFLKEWACLKLLGIAFGYNNYFIAVGTPGDSFPPRCAVGTGPANAITKGLADVLNGFASIRRDYSLRGLSRMLGGVFRLLYGVVYIVRYNICRQAKTILKP
ncbi:C39 family peptidase [Chloroflexota bacterium]